jgi:HEPN domain-containing protein
MFELLDVDSSDAVVWFFHCRDYYNASTVLDNHPDESNFSSAVCTLQAFSAECGLKSLLSLCNIEKRRGHDLVKLFEMLPESSRSELTAKFNLLYHCDFKDELEMIKDDFIDSRYCLTDTERDGRVFSVSSLNNVSKFLYPFLKPKIEAILHRYVSASL